MGGFIAAAEIGVLTIVQNIVIDEYRARVISIILAIVVGVPAFGSLALGWLADRVGFQVAQGVAVILALIFILPLGRILVSRSVELEAQPFETE